MGSYCPEIAGCSLLMVMVGAQSSDDGESGGVSGEWWRLLDCGDGNGGGCSGTRVSNFGFFLFLVMDLVGMDVGSQEN